MAVTPVDRWTVTDTIAWLTKNSKKLPSSEALAVYVHQDKIDGATLLSYKKEDCEKFGFIPQHNFQKILEKLHKENESIIKKHQRRIREESKKKTKKVKQKSGATADFDSGVDDTSISESPDCPAGRRAISMCDDSSSSANTSGTASFGVTSYSGGSTHHHHLGGVPPVSYDWEAVNRDTLDDQCYVAPEDVDAISRPPMMFGDRQSYPPLPQIEDEPITMYENHSSVAAQFEVDGGGEQFYMNAQEQIPEEEEEGEEFADETLYMNMTEGEQPPDHQDLTRRLTAAMGAMGFNNVDGFPVPVRPPVAPDPMAAAPRRPLEPPIFPKNSRPPPTVPKGKPATVDRGSSWEQDPPPVVHSKPPPVQSKPANWSGRAEIPDKQETKPPEAKSGLSIKERAALLHANISGPSGVPKRETSRETSGIMESQGSIASIQSRSLHPTTDDIKLQPRPSRQPDIPQKPVIPVKPSREPPKNPPPVLPPPGNSPPSLPPSLSPRPPQQYPGMPVPPAISRLPPPLPSSLPPAEEETSLSSNCYKDVVITLPPPPSSFRPGSRPPLPPAFPASITGLPDPYPGGEEEDDLVYQLEPDEEPEAIYNDDEIGEEILGYIPNVTKRQDAENLLRQDSRASCYLVRDSTASPEYPYVLSIKVNGSFEHTRLGIRPSGRLAMGVPKAGEMSHADLASLVRYHTNKPIMLKGRTVLLRNPVVFN